MDDSEENPFRVQKTREIYENPWIKLTEFGVVNPAGNSGIYGVVHFKNRAVGVIPYEGGQIWLVGQFRFALHRYSWEIPEGGAPEGESLEQTARRELKEETGFEAKRLRSLLTMHLSNSVTDEYGEVFLATDLTAGTPNPEETEQLKVKQVSLAEAYAMVSAGEITDSLSVTGILKLVLMEKEGLLP